MDQEPSPADNPYQTPLPEGDVNKSRQPTTIQIVLAVVMSLIAGVFTFNVTCLGVTVAGTQLLRNYISNPFGVIVVGIILGGVAGVWISVKGYHQMVRSSVEKNRR
ncbi:MAG: hypothetical protein U0996_16125 [Planctomycetaceae bacterium]